MDSSWHLFDEVLVAFIILSDLDTADGVRPFDQNADLVNSKTVALICEHLCHLIPSDVDCFGAVTAMHNLGEAGFVAIDRVLCRLLPDIGEPLTDFIQHSDGCQLNVFAS